MSLEIAEVDPFDEQSLGVWHAVLAEAARDGLGEAATLWTLPELRAALQHPQRRIRSTVVTGRVDGQVVVSGLLTVPMLDNLRTAGVEVYVASSHRRRSYGTAILEHLEAAAAAHGRTVLDSEVSWPYDLGAGGDGWPGREFARARGYALTLGDVQRVLDLPVDDAPLDRLGAEAAPHHRDHTLVSWVGPVAEDLATSWLTLSSTLNTEAPTGDRDIEDETVDVAALREAEALLVRQGRTRFHTVALDAVGEVVAYTDIVSTVHEPGRAYQWGTLVRRDARGHRLGLAVKVANLQQVQRERPDLRRVVTYNAEVNTHMIGVNEQLGFRTVARLGEFQKSA